MTRVVLPYHLRNLARVQGEVTVGVLVAFIAALNKSRTARVWPKEEKGNDHAIWNLEYIAFFAQPLDGFGDARVLGRDDSQGFYLRTHLDHSCRDSFG